MRVEQVDEEYEAELQLAYRSVSWGCLLFILGMIGAAIVLLVLGSIFGASLDSFLERP